MPACGTWLSATIGVQSPSTHRSTASTVGKMREGRGAMIVVVVPSRANDDQRTITLMMRKIRKVFGSEWLQLLIGVVLTVFGWAADRAKEPGLWQYALAPDEYVGVMSAVRSMNFVWFNRDTTLYPTDHGFLPLVDFIRTHTSRPSDVPATDQIVGIYQQGSDDVFYLKTEDRAPAEIEVKDFRRRAEEELLVDPIDTLSIWCFWIGVLLSIVGVVRARRNARNAASSSTASSG